MAIVSGFLTALVAVLHIGFFVLEYFTIKTPAGAKIFKVSEAHLQYILIWAQNQAVYNLMLAFGLFWTLVSKNDAQSMPVRIFILIFIIVVGLYGGWTVGKNVYFMQALPAFLALFATLVLMAQPRINDITTSFEHPPQFVSLAQKEPSRSFEYPKGFAALQQQYYPAVAPLVVDRSVTQVFDELEKIIKAMETCEVVAVDKQALRVEATCTSQFFRFKDDFVIQLKPVKETLTEINMRSKSRSGQSDFAVNAKRIKEVLATINAVGR